MEKELHFIQKQEDKEIKPSLFKIDIDNTISYIIAYDAKQALENLPNYHSRDLEKLKSVTNLTANYGEYLYITPECLGVPKLTNKKVKKYET